MLRSSWVPCIGYHWSKIYYIMPSSPLSLISTFGGVSFQLLFTSNDDSLLISSIHLKCFKSENVIFQTLIENFNMMESTILQEIGKFSSLHSSMNDLFSISNVSSFDSNSASIADFQAFHNGNVEDIDILFGKSKNALSMGNRQLYTSLIPMSTTKITANFHNKQEK